ncbi:MAG: hypothetical protein ACRECV_02650 [Xanthobacteraceae bacterium]
MRWVFVNGAKLKAEAACSHCGNKIAESYVREIGSPSVYCDFHCYSVAVEASVKVLGYRAPALSAGSRNS